VGALVRATEPHFDLVECFDAKKNTCPIDPVCGLKGVLKRAQGAFPAGTTFYRVPSSCKPGVRYVANGVCCTCRDSQVNGRTCKHSRAVVLVENAPRCQRCGIEAAGTSGYCRASKYRSP
jgi:hypothetical protein